MVNTSARVSWFLFAPAPNKNYASDNNIASTGSKGSRADGEENEVGLF